MLTVDERLELERLNWLHRYYLDSWLATMQVLDLVRPSVVALSERQHEIINLLHCDEVTKEEAQRLALTALRIWHAEYRETMQVVRSSPN